MSTRWRCWFLATAAGLGASSSDIERLFTVPPDTRHANCQKNLSAHWPHVSIIIPYLNETWHHIQATVASILWATDMDLVDRLVFVDDGNSPEMSYKADIEGLHPKIYVHSNGHRRGLIQSKIIGAAIVDSPILFFLEPHCIVNRQWLEPILEHMVRGGTGTIVMPVLDLISETNFSDYSGASGEVGGFNWQLDFLWYTRPERRNSTYVEPHPYESPALSGGILGIWRSFWDEIGMLDPEMREWGGEHIELSLRTWRCGGRIEVVPCSRIGHMFRAKVPYKVNIPYVMRNLKRVVDVWFDEYSEHVYQATASLRTVDAGYIGERLALRDRLDCKSMSWYIQNVYPELEEMSAGWSDPHRYGQCEDRHHRCGIWAADGECETKPSYMRTACQRSCNLCEDAEADMNNMDVAAIPDEL